MNHDIKKEWVEALRSGEYKQGKMNLRSKNDEYCCLGVLCDIYRKKVAGAPDWNPVSDLKKTYQYGDSYGYPPVEVRDWAGHDVFQYIDASKHAPEQVDKNYGEAQMTLVALNDGGATFEQIANLIEESL